MACSRAVNHFKQSALIADSHARQGAAEEGRREGRRIVAEHGGKTGEALVVSVLTRTDPALAGQYVGQRIVDKHGGRTGKALVEEMLRCMQVV